MLSFDRTQPLDRISVFLVIYELVVNSTHYHKICKAVTLLRSQRGAPTRSIPALSHNMAEFPNKRRLVRFGRIGHEVQLASWKRTPARSSPPKHHSSFYGKAHILFIAQRRIDTFP